MRASQASGAVSQSCSCTSCLYKSESERPSVKRIIADGSRIDKLYFGKYIPLREQKLLDKLVRTRAVYDDIRNQLLSESDASIKEKANLKPRKHVQVRRKDLTATDKSSAIMELVDLVDKGKVAGRKNLSECCSCCSCGLKLNHTHEPTSHMRRHRHAHGKVHGGAYTMSRTSMIRKKIGEVRRSIKFKAKSIRSAPCTCTSKISDMIKRQSQEIIKRLRPEGSKAMLEQTLMETYEQTAGGQRKRRMIKKTYHKMQKSKTRLMQSMGEGARKIKESKTKIKEHIEAEGKNSLEKIKKARNKVKENVKTVVRKSIRNKQPPTEEFNFEEIDFPIKKDSITKFKERLIRKKTHDYYACEHDCIPDECVPEDCFKIIKLRRIRRENKQKGNKVNSSIEKNIVTTTASSVAVQANQKAHKQKSLAMTENSHKQDKIIKRSRPSPEQRISVDVGIKKTGIEPRVVVSQSRKLKDKLTISCACEEVQSKDPPIEATAVKSKKSSLSISEPVIQQKFPKNKNAKQESPSLRSGIEIRKEKSTAVKVQHKKSAAAGQINMNKHKPRKSSQTILKHTIKDDHALKTGSHALRRCFCTLKLKAKGNRIKTTKSSSINTTTASQSMTSHRKLDQKDKHVQEHVETKGWKHHKPDCIDCISEKCDPTDCIKHKKRRPISTGVGVKPRQKSVSSLTSKSLSTGSLMTHVPKKVNKLKKHSSSSSKKLDQLQETPSQKQVVRIGSTFSFSIEFYKDRPKDEISKLMYEKITGDRIKKNRSATKRKQLRHKHSQISSSTGKSKYTLTKHSLRRCFCTLKLVHADKKKMKVKTRSQGSFTTQHTPDVTFNVNKAIATDKYKLYPYECEPGICQPGECNPYVCQKRINTRKIKYRTKQSNTDNQNAKSISSLTSGSVLSRAKKVQSTTATYRSNKKQKGNGKTLRRIRTTPSSPERQGVRLSSSFSFNIEFHKDNDDNMLSSSPASNMPNKQPLKSSEITKYTKKNQSYQEKVKKRQKSTSMLVKKKNRGSFIAPSMKRCFCTLKLHKAKEDKNKKVVDQVTTGTETPESNFVDYKNVVFTKGTKTKQDKDNFAYTLEPYECEPYVCEPGECNPFECLKKIQNRQLKETSTITDKAKMKSVTNITYKSKFKSRGALAKSKFKAKKVLTNVENFGGDIELQKPLRQAVRIGSTFSFNIEFKKDMSRITTIKEKDIKNVKNFKDTKNSKHNGVRAKFAISRHQNTQMAPVKQAHKTAGIRPMIKRCFCTLKLKNMNNQKAKINIKPQKEITVSRVTVTETKIIDNKALKIVSSENINQGLNWSAKMYNISSSMTLSQSSFRFQYKEMKSYFCNQKSCNSLTSNSLSDQVSKASPCSMIVHSNSILPTYYTKVSNKYTCSENCILKRANKGRICIQKRNNILKCKEKYITTQKLGFISEPHTNASEQQDIKTINHNQISSLRYYAMNVQVPQGNKNIAKRPVQYKLKSYECEPGICVPDQCDPYECEKLIRKRLIKRVNRMSGTNIRSKSISSYASQSTLNSKTKKLQSKRAPRETVKKIPASGIKYESGPRRNHKQAVRVGSSFSFNIEFSKGQSSPDKYTPRESPKLSIANKPTKPPRKVVKAKGTKGDGVEHYDQDSQSINFTENKGSSMKPMMQRCFCTLKLQKKGKKYKIKNDNPVQHAFHKGTATPPNTLKDFVVSRTMTNSGQNTVHQKPHKLLPYECEPKVCIPGECDPYECLERIKQRNKKFKNSGTGAMRYNTSSSSNTGQRTRTRAKPVQSQPRSNQRSRESAATRSSNVVTYHTKPSRQAVRIGSSFSFNVEFFKDKSQASPSPTIGVQRESKPSVDSRSAPKRNNLKKKVRVVGLQNHKSYKNRTSQMDNVQKKGKSTMTTSFIKRCFCTAKLHGKGQRNKIEKVKQVHRQEKIKHQAIVVESKASQAVETKSFLKRCFCVLKLKKGVQNSKQKNVYANTNLKIKDTPITVDKKVVTAHYRNRPRNLEPYECEPGICVPGECNPYKCKKLIKARNIKLDTREAFTDRTRTRSTSSSFKSSKTSKARRTQSNFRSPSTVSGPQLTSSRKVVKDLPRNVEPIRHSNRQVVRIGSNFSFNVEFYKDRSPNTEDVQAAAKAIRRKPPRTQPKLKTAQIGNEHKIRKKTKHKGTVGSSVPTDNRESQANKTKTEDRSSRISPALKRCFCTLKLQKRDIQTAKYTTQKTSTNAVKEIPTLQNRSVMTTGKNRKLKPYECEPYVCVPYECDPYECEKLIKKRNFKENTKAVMTTKKEKYIVSNLLPYECEPNFCIPGKCDPYECEKRIKLRNIKHKTSGTSTKRYTGKSISSEMRSALGSKARKVQSSKNRDRNRSKSVSSKQFRSKKSLDSTRQSVKIGSGFSFDIEFYKNKSLSKPETRVRSVKQTVTRTKSISSSARLALSRTKNNKMQYRQPMRHTDSQILVQKMRDTGVNPFLKRCFCTLKLQNSNEIPSKHAIGRAARDKNVYLATLLPYECEPGICVPGECNPYECDKRIKRRQMRSKLAGTERRSQDSSTSSTATKYRAAKNQVMSPHAQAQKYQKSTYAKREYRKPHRPKINHQNTSRQAVRLGSSFKFDVEFYKDNSQKLQEQSRIYKRKKENIKVKPVMQRTRSKSITSSEVKRQNSKMQTKGSKTESKSTGFGPLLKRCFCTLALHKQKTPPPSQTKATNRNDDISDLYQFSRNVGVGTSKKFYKLKPYECEPNVCIPGQCNPYECYERIKRRLKDTGTETPRPRKKYASSITSKQTKFRSANTQAMKANQRKDRPSMTSTFKERVKQQRAPRYSSTSDETTRQAVKIGSNFSFSLEFYKERPNAVKIPKAVYKMKGLDEKRKIYNTSKTSPLQKTIATKPLFAQSKGYDQKCQVDCVKNTSKGTTMGAFIKRCFCTLNLHKNPPRTSMKEKYLPKVIKQPQTKKKLATQYSTRPATSQTKEKYTARKTLSYKLKPYECEPNICVPEECNPHECLERIKQRNIRRHSRRTGTHMRSSQVSVSSMASRLVPRTSRRVQSGLKRTRKVSHPQQVPRIVEQPRFANMFDSSNKTGVKFGSNVSFNIEFYKDKSQIQDSDSKKRYYDYKPKEPKVKRIARHSTFSESRPKGIHKSIGDKSCDLRTCESQADSAILKNKATDVNNILNRCFCTLKLQKNAKKAPQVITVNRVDIEENYINGFMYSQKVKNNQQNSLYTSNDCHGENKYSICKRIKRCGRKTFCFNDYINTINESKEMKTIYPYTPNKYNKNVSNTTLLRNTMDCKNDLPNRMPTGKTTQQSYFSKKNTMLLGQTSKESAKRLLKTSDGKTFLHKLFSRLFSKRKSTENQKAVKIVTRQPTKNMHLYKPDALKSSKSDRRPNNVKTVKLPKKTTSLKLTKISNKIRTEQESQKHRKTSLYQSGDAGQMCTLQDRHLNFKKTQNLSNMHDLSKMNVRMPYENNKIVQMAIIKPSARSKQTKHYMVNTKTNTEVKKTRAKSVETTDNPYKKESFLDKCKCIFNRITSKNHASIKSKNQLLKPGDNRIKTDDDELKTYSNVKKTRHNGMKVGKNRKITGYIKIKSGNNTMKGGDNEIKTGDNGMKTSDNGMKTGDNGIKTGNDKRKSGDNRIRISGNRMKPGDLGINADDFRTNVGNTGIKSCDKKNKIVLFNAGEGKVFAVIDNATGCPCPKNRQKILSSGDNQVGEQNNNVKFGKTMERKVDENSKNADKLKKKRKKSALQSGDAPDIETNGVEIIKNQDEKAITEINTITPVKCKYATPCPCCKGKSSTKKSLLSTGVAPAVTRTGKSKQKATTRNNLQDKQSKALNGKKHGASNKLYGAKISIKAKGDPYGHGGIPSKAGKMLQGQDRTKPCVCRSKVCAKESKKIKVLTKMKKEMEIQPCICGSDVCANEAKKRIAAAAKLKNCECEEICKKRQAMIKEKAEAAKRKKQKEKALMKKYKQDDKKRKQKRLKAEKLLAKQSKKYKKTPDGILAAESLLDVMKLCVTTGGDVARCSSRAVMHPRITYRNLQNLANDPSRGVTAIGAAVQGSGVFSTCKRVRQRCCAMKVMKKAKNKMESNPVTYFLLHAADKNPKKRMAYKKKQMKRRREPIDFECSLFMASLRRKPCLAVYYTCPWFYPHCLSMLTLWKQFTDVMLFLIAVTIWSPCIVGMEICRAFVCCFFCTG